MPGELEYLGAFAALGERRREPDRVIGGKTLDA
jgi:hypothetical protein